MFLAAVFYITRLQLPTDEIHSFSQQQLLAALLFLLICSHLQLLAGEVSPLATLALLLPVLVQLVLAVRYLRAL